MDFSILGGGGAMVDVQGATTVLREIRNELGRLSQEASRAIAMLEDPDIPKGPDEDEMKVVDHIRDIASSMKGGSG